MSAGSRRDEIQHLLAGISSLESRVRQSGTDRDEALDESLEELRTSIEQLRVADDELRGELEARLALQAALDAESQRYRDRFQLGPGCELITDERGTIRVVNVAAARLLGVPAGFLVGKPLAIFVPLDDRRLFRDALGRLVTLGQAAELELRIRPRGGAPIETAISVAPVRDAAGQVEGLQWLIRDVTLRKRAEASARALQAELEQRVAERTAALEEANRQAGEAIRARDRLLSIISHDLKHPLTVIKGYVQILDRSVQTGRVMSPAGMTETLGKMEAAIDRLTTQIDEILDVSRGQLGREPELRRQPVDLVGLVRQAVAEYQAGNPRHRILVESDQPEVGVAGDPARLARVLDNLLSNAVKFSPQGGDVVVHVGREAGESGDWATVSIADSGLGIPAADLPLIFDLFHRATNVVGNVPGAGMGLASARQIVELHGGTIEVTSQVGVGTTFLVRLPMSSRT